MTKNPILNAIVAELYIVLVVVFFNLGAKVQVGKDNEFLAPLAMISLFTLSAAVMTYVFGSEPLQMFLEGKKKEGINLFVKTVGVFGMLTVVLLGLMFSRILR